jgi:hypothetical protein
LDKTVAQNLFIRGREQPISDVYTIFKVTK